MALYMQKTLFFQLLSISLFFLFPLFSQPLAAQKRVALVIGNGDYKIFKSLHNPTNDATDMEKKLKLFGFEVEKLLNADKRTIEEAINRFGKKLNQKDAVGLFYFAGHGLQVKGINYLVPINSNIYDEADVVYEAVNAGRVLSKMELAENNLNLVILDACRNNPIKGSSRSGIRGLARMEAPKGSMILYATSPGKEAFDGKIKGQNGLFTGKLLKTMSIPELKIYEVFQKTAQAVVKASDSKQVPYIEGVILGDFYFNGGIKVKQANIQVENNGQLSIKNRHEITFWNSVDKTPSIESYQLYLDKYPNGHYKDLATMKIKQLAKAKNTNKSIPINMKKTYNIDHKTKPFTKDDCNNINDQSSINCLF